MQTKVSACRSFLNKHYIQSDNATDIPILIDSIFRHNTITFNDSYNLQTNGTAIVAKMAPAYENVFMEFFENSFLSYFPSKPTVYYRCIDNIFMIWAHGIDKFIQFLNNANSTYHNITLAYESTTTLTVLDVLIKTNNTYHNITLIYETTTTLIVLDGLANTNTTTIYTAVYSKHTDRHSYLHCNGIHAIHLKHCIIFSQFLRY